MKTLQRKRSPKSDLAWRYNSYYGSILYCQGYVNYLNRAGIIDTCAFSIITKQLLEAKRFLKFEYNFKKQLL